MLVKESLLGLCVCYCLPSLLFFFLLLLLLLLLFIIIIFLVLVTFLPRAKHCTIDPPLRGKSKATNWEDRREKEDARNDKSDGRREERRRGTKEVKKKQIKPYHYIASVPVLDTGCSLAAWLWNGNNINQSKAMKLAPVFESKIFSFIRQQIIQN